MGRFVGLKGDTLSFAAEQYTGSTMRVLLDDKTTVEVCTSRHNQLLPGLVGGGLLGFGIGWLIVAVQDARRHSFLPPLPPHEEASHAPMAIGLAAGCGLGALIGAANFAETWAGAPLPRNVSLRFSTEGAAGVRVALTMSR